MSVPSMRELIVMMDRGVQLRVNAQRIRSLADRDVSELSRVLNARNARLRPLFGTTEERLRAEFSRASATSRLVPDLSVYYRVETTDAQMDALAMELREIPEVRAAYVKPPAELPTLMHDMPPAADAPPASPSFRDRQRYLLAAPGGVDALHAWKLAGGRGAGVRVIDIEGAWRFTHEDLLQNQNGVVGGTPTDNVNWRNHGTAVIGVIGGDDDEYGVVGIAPEASVSAVSIFGGMGSSGAIRHAANLLGPGDIILIELHRAGPRFGYAQRGDQRGYIAVEWWPDDFDAIVYATSRGIIVVEAAGNGAEDLDDGLYDTPDPGFPAGWRNPFRRGARDSGAIVVGAGAPDSGAYGPDRSRLDFSNYGAAVDAQGWGREVTTCGYGDLQGGDEDRWYTGQFSGTSSASPVVVGALACLQGNTRTLGLPHVTPARAREILRSTGSPQQDAPNRPASQRIGNRPDLARMLAVNTQAPRIKSLAGASNGDGRLEVFTVALDKGVWHIWQSSPSSGPWSRFRDLGGQVKQLSAYTNKDGRLEVFGIGMDGALYNIWQTKPSSGPWSQWNRLGGVVKQIAATRNSDGRLEVFGIGSDDALYNIWQTKPSSGPWSQWNRLGGVVKQIVAAKNGDGRLEVFGIGSDDALYNIWQTKPSSGPWSQWNRLSGVVKQIVVATNGDGRLEVFGIGSDDALYNIWQTKPSSGPWSQWNRLGGVVKQIAVARNSDGRLEVFGIGSDDALYNIWQTKPSSGPWSDWNRLGGVVKQIAVARNSDGRLEVFGIGSDDALYNIWQTKPSSGPWSDWNRLS